MLKCLQVTNTIDYLLVTDVEREGEGLSFVRWERSLSELFHTPMLVPAFTKNYWINPKYLAHFPHFQWCRKMFYSINTKCRTTTSTPATFFLKLATQKFRHRIINDVKSLKNSCRNDGLSTVTFSSMKRRIFSISSPDGASPFFFCRQCFKAFCSSPLTLQNKLKRLTYQVFSG